MFRSARTRPSGIPGARSTIVLLLAVFLTLTGCAVSQVESGQSLTTDSNSGIAVLSLTHSGQRGFDLLYQLEGPGILLYQAILLPGWSELRDWNGAPGAGPTPEDDPQGRLVALRLKPGTYRIRYWSGTSNLGGFHALGYEVYGDPISIEFTVAGDTVTYVGNVHLALPERLDYLASMRSKTYRIDVQDRSERDLALLRRKHPNVGSEPITKAIAQYPLAGQPRRYYVINFSDSDEPLTAAQ